MGTADEPRSHRPPVVLVAEDSLTVRRLICRILVRAGFEVIEAADGIEALTLAAVHQPQIALLDVEMPGCDGIEALRRMKQWGATSPQVVMLSAVDDISALSEALELGALDYVRKPCRPPELVARVRRAVGVALEADELRERSVTDDLTGLPNRRGLRLLLESLAAPASARLGVAIVDADHFKRVNDEWGHHTGDVVLRAIADRLGRAWPTVTVGRWGGEEFLAVFPARDDVDAAEIAERLRAAVAQSPIDTGTACPPLEITVSVGLAVIARGVPIDGALLAADAALYEAKDGGRNQVVVADPARVAART